jgi:hypothetical protein
MSSTVSLSFSLPVVFVVSFEPRCNLVHATGDYSERLVGYHNFEEGLRLAIWDRLRVQKEEFQEATVISVLVRVEVTVITENLGNLLDTQRRNHAWSECQVDRCGELRFPSQKTNVLLVFGGLKVVNSAGAKLVQHHLIQVITLHSYWFVL